MKLGFFFAEIQTPLLAYIPALGTQQFLTTGGLIGQVLRQNLGVLFLFFCCKQVTHYGK